MKENKYDDNIFFQKYSQMSRSQQGLAGAGEWETLRKLLPGNVRFYHSAIAEPAKSHLQGRGRNHT